MTLSTLQGVSQVLGDCSVNRLDVSIARGRDVEIHIAQGPQRIVRAEPGQGYDSAPGFARRAGRAQNVRGLPGTADRHEKIAGRGPQPEERFVGGFVALVVGERGEKRRLCENEGADAHRFAKVVLHVARYGGAAAVADDDDRAVAIPRGADHPDGPRRAVVERCPGFRRREEAGHLAEIAGERHFKTASMCFINGIGSMGRWFATMPTACAPTMLAVNPTTSIGAPCATQSAVTAKTASPAPTRSTMWLVNAGTS